MMEIDQDKIRSIVAQVIENIQKQGLIEDIRSQPSSKPSKTSLAGKNGIFTDVDSAVSAAEIAQKELIA